MSVQEFEKIEGAALSAINDSQHSYRTVRGIAEETNIDQLVIAEVAHSSRKILKSRKRNQWGEPLFTTSQKVNKMPLLEQWKSAIAGSV